MALGRRACELHGCIVQGGDVKVLTINHLFIPLLRLAEQALAAAVGGGEGEGATGQAGEEAEEAS